MSGAENQKSSKNPITLKIKFKSSSLDQFIERYSVDVSKSGIFIRTKDPLAVGTVLRFEFQLQDGTPLIGGDGTVVWNRPFDANKQSVAPGMGVRFDKLTADSQRVLDQILGEKDRRGETQMESRFDAGVRASQSMSSEASLAQSQTTPQAQSQFGDEPTRALPADQMHKLAEAMQHGAMEEDQPTRKGSITDLPEDMRKLAVKALSAEKSGSLAAAGAGAQSSEQPAATNKPPASLARTLIGAGAGGFGMAGKAAAIPTPAALAKPAEAPKPAAAEPSPSAITPVQAAPLPAESKRTPTQPVDDKGASSERTPTGPVTPTASPVVPVVAPIAAAAAASAPPAVAAAVSGTAATPAKSTDAAPAPVPQTGSSPKGLLIGTVVLLGAVAVAGYIYLTTQKPVVPPQPPQPPQPTVQQPQTPPVVAPSTPLPPPEPVKPVEPTPATPPDKTGKPEAGKPEAGKPEAGKPEAANDSLEVTTEPPGAQVELAGKPVGMTPTRLADLAVGKVYEIKVTLAGYQEVRQKVKRAEGENKPVAIKLQPIERLVEVNSVPKGIDVFLDGKKVGKTPAVLKKLDFSKPHTVELKKTGFEVWSHNITDAETFVVKNKKEVLTLNATLEAAKGGKPTGRGGRKPSDAGAAPATPAKPAEAPKPEAAKPAEAPKPEAAKPAEAPKPEAPKAEAPKAEPAKPKAESPKPSGAEDAPN